MSKSRILSRERHQELLEKFIVPKEKTVISWKIIDAAKAENYHISIIKGDCRDYLVIDHAYIPDNLSFSEYLDFLIEKEIILKKML